MKASQLRKVFPPGTLMPEALTKLCKYSEEVNEVIGCDFVLTADGNAANAAFFPDNETAQNQLVVFGMDEFQSLYAYWLYNDLPLEQAPIVYLNSESTANTILANTIEEFLALLALGKEEIGFVEGWEEQAEPCDGSNEFRAWLRNEFNITPPGDVKAIVERARQAHPNFDDWVHQQQSG